MPRATSLRLPAGVMLAIAASAGAQTVDVVIESFSYSPGEFTIAPMTTVRWTNFDDIEHTVTSQTGPGTLIKSGLFDSGSLFLGDVFEFTFTDPGDYDYFCIPHGGAMQGVVHVVPAPAGAAALGGVGALALRRPCRSARRYT